MLKAVCVGVLQYSTLIFTISDLLSPLIHVQSQGGHRGVQILPNSGY